MKTLNRNVIHNSGYSELPGVCLHLKSAGFFTSSGNSHFIMTPSHFGPHVITRGRGTLSWPGGECELKAGSVFALYPGMRVSFWDTPESPWQYYWLHITGEDVEAFANICGFHSDSPILASKHFRKLLHSVKDLWAWLDPKRAAHPYVIQAKLYQFAALCSTFADTLEQRKHLESVVEQAKFLIDSQLHSAINIIEIATILSVSRTTLFYAFRNELGISPMDYLNQKRIDKAKTILLNHQDYRIADVARACGFTHEKYFMRRFKEATGQTPSNWKNRAL